MQVLLALATMMAPSEVESSIAQTVEPRQGDDSPTTWDVVWISNASVARCTASAKWSFWSLADSSRGVQPTSLEAWIRPLSDVTKVELVGFRGGSAQFGGTITSRLVAGSTS